ncbi:MAG TPA: ATP synthase F1 subunit delta [Alphaproteobacteria bacterium]|nr:ATP synthase F1 subunit delta [Alphaproteobacteria bacterium]
MKKEPIKNIAKQYALSLFDAAEEQGKIKQVCDDIQKLEVMLKDDVILKDLNSPLIKKAQKNELIALISKTLKLNIITTNLLKVLADNKRFDVLKEIFGAFEDINLKKSGILKVLVETAEPLSATQEKKLKEGLQKKLKKDVILSYKLNENLLGGLILYYDSVQIDDSIKSKLKTMEQMMKGLK